jgi:hypothetical protein
MIAAEPVAYRCAPAIAWVKDVRQTILVAAETGESWTLCGVEAAIWDLLTLNYPAEQITRLLSVLLALSPEQAAATLAGAIRTWAEAGILIATPPVAPFILRPETASVAPDDFNPEAAHG